MTNKGRMGTVILTVAALAAGYYVMTMPDNRTASEHIGDAIHDLDKGPDKAVRQLQDRTPGQKVGDAIKDATKSGRD